jgi:hypothetical protein
MFTNQRQRYINLVGPVNATQATNAVTARIDTFGFKAASVFIQFAPATAAGTNTPIACSLSFTDVATATSGTAFLQATSGTSPTSSQWTITGNSGTAAGSIYKLDVANPPGRYLILSVTPMNNTTYTHFNAFALLDRADESPSSTTEAVGTATGSAWARQIP